LKLKSTALYDAIDADLKEEKVVATAFVEAFGDIKNNEFALDLMKEGAWTRERTDYHL